MSAHNTDKQIARAQKLTRSTKPQYAKKRSLHEHLSKITHATLLLNLKGLSANAASKFKQHMSSQGCIVKTVKCAVLNKVLSAREISRVPFVTDIAAYDGKISEIKTLLDQFSQQSFYKKGDIADRDIIIEPMDTKLRMGKYYALIEEYLPVKLVKGFITIPKKTTLLKQGESISLQQATLLRVLGLSIKTIRGVALGLWKNKTLLRDESLAHLIDPLGTTLTLQTVLRHIAEDRIDVELHPKLTNYAIIKLITGIMSKISMSNTSTVLKLILQLIIDKGVIAREQTISALSKKLNVSPEQLKQLSSTVSDEQLESYLDLKAAPTALQQAPAETVSQPVEVVKEEPEQELDLGALF